MIPPTSILYPEIRLFERMFARFGAEAVIADANELVWREGRLWHGARRDSAARDWAGRRRRPHLRREW